MRPYGTVKLGYIWLKLCHIWLLLLLLSTFINKTVLIPSSSQRQGFVITELHKTCVEFRNHTALTLTFSRFKYIT